MSKVIYHVDSESQIPYQEPPVSKSRCCPVNPNKMPNYKRAPTKKDNIKCELLIKAEFMNPGGSIKDRITRRSVLEKKAENRNKPGDILIEPNSGDTGVVYLWAPQQELIA